LKASLGLGLGILSILDSLVFLQFVRKLALGKLVAGLEHSILVMELHKQEVHLEPHILEPHKLELMVEHIAKLVEHIAKLVEHIAELVVSSFGFLVELSIQPLVAHKLRSLELRIPLP
jgi:hypothetical protein